MYVFTSSIPTASAMMFSLLNLFTDWLLLCVKVPIFGNICSHHIWRDCIMRALHVTIFMVCMFSSWGNYPHSVPLIEAPALKVPIIILWLWSLHTAYLHYEGWPSHVRRFVSGMFSSGLILCPYFYHLTLSGLGLPCIHTHNWPHIHHGIHVRCVCYCMWSASKLFGLSHWHVHASVCTIWVRLYKDYVLYY